MKKRIIIIGSTGIISSNLQRRLKKNKLNFISVGRKKINLKGKMSYRFLNKIIKSKDIIVFIAAEAPVKNTKMFINNMKICNNICKAIENKKISKIIYISSDAVYSDIKSKIHEKSKTLPNSIHGIMHLARETILKMKFKTITCILRPTLIYGPGDTHLGYGPNKFLKLAKKNKNILLFGKGEERRDHIYIDDLVSILIECIQKNKFGVFNLATGKINSFYEIAKKVVLATNSKSKILNTKRKGKMPHNGYRPFNIDLIKKNFSNLKLNSINEGIEKYIKEINNESRINRS